MKGLHIGATYAPIHNLDGIRWTTPIYEDHTLLAIAYGNTEKESKEIAELILHFLQRRRVWYDRSGLS